MCSSLHFNFNDMFTVEGICANLLDFKIIMNDL